MQDRHLKFGSDPCRSLRLNGLNKYVSFIYVGDIVVVINVALFASSLLLIITIIVYTVKTNGGGF